MVWAFACNIISPEAQLEGKRPNLGDLSPRVCSGCPSRDFQSTVWGISSSIWQLVVAGIGGLPSPLTMRSRRLVCRAQKLASIPCFLAVLLPLASSCRTRRGWTWVMFGGSVCGHRNLCSSPEDAVCHVDAPAPGLPPSELGGEVSSLALVFHPIL